MPSASGLCHTTESNFGEAFCHPGPRNLIKSSSALARTPGSYRPSLERPAPGDSDRITVSGCSFEEFNFLGFDGERFLVTSKVLGRSDGFMCRRSSHFYCDGSIFISIIFLANIPA